MLKTNHISNMSSHSTQFHTSKRNQNSFDCRFCKENGHTVDQCSVLANTECKYCHYRGHTTRRCPKIAEKEARYIAGWTSASRESEFAPDTNGYTKAKGTFRRRVMKDPRVTGTVHMGRFAVLNAQEEVDTKRRESTINFSNNKPVLKGSWSKPFEVSETTDSTVKSAPQSTTPQSTTPWEKIRNTTRWADMADTDSEDEDEGDNLKKKLKKSKNSKKN